MKSEEMKSKIFDSISYEFDLLQIYNILIGNKTLIAFFTIISLITSAFLGLNIKRTWKGSFQIVLEDKALSATTLTQSRYASLIGGQKNNQLATEVEILKSPIVLAQIFEFIKKEKKLKEDFSLENVRFQQWRDRNFKIDLSKRTTVLNVSYLDTDKKIILPALQKISESYQTYSGKKRLRNIELSEKFYEEQLLKFKEKSLKSQKDAQEFAIEQNLIIPLEAETNNSKPFNSLDIEKNRIEAKTKIQIIDEKLSQINSTNNSDDIYLYHWYQNYDDKMLFINQIIELDSRISNLSEIYKSNDKVIEDLIQKRKKMIQLYKKQLIGYLKSQRTNEVAKLNASSRPQGVLIKYRQLLNSSQKDQKTLDKLEEEYRFLLLEKAKSKDPWQLITKPNLLPYPIAPNRKLIVFYGLIIGLFTGCLIALSLDKNKYLIQSSWEINSITDWPLLAEYTFSNEKNWTEISNSIAENLNRKNGAIMFLSTLGMDDISIKKIFSQINSAIKDKNIFLSDNIKDYSCDQVVIVTSLRQLNRSLIVEINKTLMIQKRSALGFIIINESNKTEE